MKDECVCLVLKLVNVLLQVSLLVLNDLSFPCSRFGSMVSDLIPSQSESNVSILMTLYNKTHTAFSRCKPIGVTI